MKNNKAGYWVESERGRCVNLDGTVTSDVNEVRAQPVQVSARTVF